MRTVPGSGESGPVQGEHGPPSVEWSDPEHTAVERGSVVVHPPIAASDVLLAGGPATAELSSWLDAIAEITRAANRDAPLDELMDLIAGATAHLTVVEGGEGVALAVVGILGLSQGL